MRTCWAVLLSFSTIGWSQTVQDPASQVNPFVGTQESSQLDFGNTSPGAVLPFGMLYWSPDPASGQYYNYKEPMTRGYSLTHLSGPGCGVYGDVPIFPMLGTPETPPSARSNEYQASYRHDAEVVDPGFYSVGLSSGIRVQLAAALHSGIASFTYPAGASSHTILIDLSRNLTAVYDAHVSIRGNSVTGSVASGGFCSTGNKYTIYFALETDGNPSASGTFDEMQVRPGVMSGSGSRAGAYLSFASKTATVYLKAGISYVSIANAKMNLHSEIPGWDVEGVRRDARTKWNAVLGHALVKGGSEAQQRVFYTALYHSMLHPSVFSDVNGEYRGFDDRVHVAHGHVQYANYSGWDIYRSQVQLITMLLPNVGGDIAESLVADAREGGGLPIWPVANDESGVMSGDPSSAILSSIHAFGGQNFDTGEALTAMLRGATNENVHARLYPERPQLGEYLAKGYVAETDDVEGSASMTLEYTNADFAISQFAKAIGDAKTAQQFLVRSAYWHNLFDVETKYIRPRDVGGKFLVGFDPGSHKGFTEGNAAQYTWMIPYDLQGVVNAVGGRDTARVRLDEYFSQYGTTHRPGPHFFIGNEPSFGNPWVYNWAGYPWRAQEVVRKTLKELFTDQPDGLPGNDDLGATSSWVVFAQLGLYPEIPGVGGLTTSSPVFPDVTLQLGEHRVHIIAEGAPEKAYVSAITLDGTPIRNWWLDWNGFSNAKQLVFTMTDIANQEAGEMPPSFPAGR